MQKTHILAYASLRMDQQKQFWPVNTSSTDKSKEEISTTPFFPSIMSPLNWKMEYNNNQTQCSNIYCLTVFLSMRFENPACTTFDITNGTLFHSTITRANSKPWNNSLCSQFIPFLLPHSQFQCQGNQDSVCPQYHPTEKKNALIACLTILLLYFQLFFSYLKLNGSMFKNKIDFKMAKLYA